LFGIKAGKSWQSKVSVGATHEYEQGKKKSIKDAFRRYGSFF
jgi:flagellum-specific peptidoglycan hydrolase FlgJ